LVGIGLVTIGFAAPTLWAIAKTGSGYKAKLLCSAVFVSGRPAESVLAEELSVDGYESLRWFNQHIDREKRQVDASLFGLAGQRAVYRDGLGCTLTDSGVEGSREVALVGAAAKPNPGRPAQLWPRGERVELEALPGDVDKAQLAHAIEAAFDDPDPHCLRRTRALVVVYRGRIVAERYAPGFDAAMPLLGWSMSKTALNLLTGALLKNGEVGLEEAALMPEWREPGDPRAAITVDDLLRMSSGLSFDEDYADELSDVVTMLFRSPDSGRFAAGKPLLHEPGSYWHYSSGDSDILSAALRHRAGDLEDYQALPRSLLFEPLGMESAVFETDASGSIVGSSFMYASARDWARLGLLLLRDGVWEGERVVPEGWVEYSLTPTPGSPEGRHGAHIWLRLPGSEDADEPQFPEDAFFMRGHERQIVAMIPSRDLIVVRLGLTRCKNAWDHSSALAPIVAAFPRVEN
jgi:hypothetical protein